MITYYSKNIISNKDKSELFKSLKNLLFKDNNEYFAFFPLCLFDSKYYAFLRQKRQSPYKGKIQENEFKFERQIAIGGTSKHRIRTINIEGKIIYQKEHYKIQVKFKTHLISIIAFFSMIPLSIWAYLKMENIAWLLIVPFILVYEILIIKKDIKTIKNKTTTA